MRLAFEKLKIGFLITVIVLVLNDIFTAVYDIKSFTGVLGTIILAVGIFYIVGLLANKFIKSNVEL